MLFFRDVCDPNISQWNFAHLILRRDQEAFLRCHTLIQYLHDIGCMSATNKSRVYKIYQLSLRKKGTKAVNRNTLAKDTHLYLTPRVDISRLTLM